MSDNIKKGNEGENLAALFLVEKGYRIVQRNYRHKHSEIDLIAELNNLLVFVEVKTRSSLSFGYPEEFVDEKKISKILEGADQYLYETNWQGNVRYDVVSIQLGSSGPKNEHFEDAFH